MNVIAAFGKRSGGALLVAAGVAAVLVSGCGGSSSSPGSSGGSGTIVAQQTSLGSVLTGPTGNTVYVLLSAQGAPLPCTGSCTSTWPPLTMASGTTPHAGSGVSASLAVTTLSDGTMQVTAGGDPLYYYSGDSGAGQVHGQLINSFGGIWYAMSASGQPAKSGSGTGGGY